MRLEAEYVAVDQVGYRPEEPKRAFVVGGEAEAFSVQSDGETVLEGDLSEPIEDADSGDTVREARFDSLGPGEYVVRAGGVESHPFTVAPGVFADPLRTVARHYNLRRSATRVEDPVTGLEFGPGHEQDREAELYFSDPFHDEGDELDVSGGWYDAGDYGKYVPPAAITVGQLLLTAERFPETSALELRRPVEGPEAPSDLLSEARFELEWLARMQRPDGACYHKVAGEEWPAIDTAPGEDTMERYVFGLSTYGTAMVAAVGAQAARLYEGAFAERMLTMAEDAFDYLEANPDPEFRFDEGQAGGSGPYRKEEDREERFWAAAELLKTTGEERYKEYLHGEHKVEFAAEPVAVEWSNALALGQWAYYTADAGEEGRKETLAEGFLTYAESLAEHVQGDGYRCALASEEYLWSSTKLALAKGNVCSLAAAIAEGESEREDAAAARYREIARDQLHYALGRTPTGYSYVTGVGEEYPERPHDRLSEGTGTLVPGLLVGGANRYGQDEVMEAYIERESPPPAKCYLDRLEAYSVNEYAIDYVAPLVHALAEAEAGY